MRVTTKVGMAYIHPNAIATGSRPHKKFTLTVVLSKHEARAIVRDAASMLDIHQELVMRTAKSLDAALE